jgi:hypothetical protein
LFTSEKKEDDGEPDMDSLIQGCEKETEGKKRDGGQPQRHKAKTLRLRSSSRSLTEDTTMIQICRS